jgi:hypothetical protein
MVMGSFAQKLLKAYVLMSTTIETHVAQNQATIEKNSAFQTELEASKTLNVELCSRLDVMNKGFAAQQQAFDTVSNVAKKNAERLDMYAKSLQLVAGILSDTENAHQIEEIIVPSDDNDLDSTPKSVKCDTYFKQTELILHLSSHGAPTYAAAVKSAIPSTTPSSIKGVTSILINPNPQRSRATQTRRTLISTNTQTQPRETSTAPNYLHLISPMRVNINIPTEAGFSSLSVSLDEWTPNTHSITGVTKDGTEVTIEGVESNKDHNSRGSTYWYDVSVGPTHYDVMSKRALFAMLRDHHEPRTDRPRQNSNRNPTNNNGNRRKPRYDYPAADDPDRRPLRVVQHSGNRSNSRN